MSEGKIEIHTDVLSTWDALSDAEWGRLVKAMLTYRLTGQAEQLLGAERIMFSGERVKIDRQLEAEEKRRARTRERVTRYRALQSVTERYTPSPSSPPSSSPPSSPPTPPVITPSSLSPVLTSPPKEKPPKGGKKKAPTAEIEGLGFGADLTIAFSDWLQYKQERGEQYKPKGLEMLTALMRKNAEIYGETAVAELIRECMSSNWQGIIWDRLKNRNGFQKGSAGGSGNIFMDMLREEEGRE